MTALTRWTARARSLRQKNRRPLSRGETPETPWYAKALAFCVIAYALSPIDLIPDPIPMLGHLDDFLLILLGLTVVRRLIPDAIRCECRARAAEMQATQPRSRWAVAGVIIAVWLIVLWLAGTWVWRAVPG